MSEAEAESPVSAETAPDQLTLSEDLVIQLREVVERRGRVEGLLQSAEDGKDHVKPEIYEKVTSDYRRQLDEIAAEYSPLRDRAGEELRRIREREQVLRWELGEINDTLEELRFRCQVGEFDEAELKRREKEKLDTVKSLEAKLAMVDKTMKLAGQLLGEDLEAALSSVPPSPRPQAAPAAPEPPEPAADQPVDDGTVMLQTPPAAAPPAAPQPAEPAEPVSAPPPPPADEVAEGTVLMAVPPEPAAPEESAEAPESATRDLPQALLTRKKPDAGKTFVIDKDGMVLGRSTQSDIVVQGATVSRKHAVITYQDGKYVIEDTSSGGGVLINGDRQKTWVLQNGDEIGIGAAVFEFQAP